MEPDADKLERLALEINENIVLLKVEVEKASSVRDELVNQRSESARLNKRGNINRGMILVLTVIILGMIALGAKQWQQQQQLIHITNTQRDQALCPLYQLFVNSDTAQNRANAQARGDDMVQRDEAYTIIKKSYAALGCGANLTGG